MKTKLLILLLGIAGACPFATLSGQSIPFIWDNGTPHNKSLPTDAGLFIEYLFGTPNQKGANKEVWLAKRTDGRAGTGTKEDPFNASTRVQFDTLVNGFSANTTVRLFPGEYLTQGSIAWQIENGMHIVGSGISNTTIKLADLPAGAYSQSVVGNNGFTPAGNVDYVAVSDLTVDANWQEMGSPNNKGLSGVAIHGSHILVERVRVINCHGNYDPEHEIDREAWGIIISSNYGNNCVDGVVRNCIVDQLHGNYASGIFIGGIPPKDGYTYGVLKGGRIEGNYVGVTQMSSVMTAFVDGLLIHGNYCEESTFFFRNDTGYFWNITITDNTAHVTDGGAHFINGGLVPSGDKTVDRLIVANNHFLKTDDDTTNATAVGFESQDLEDPITVQNAVIAGNILTNPSTAHFNLTDADGPSMENFIVSNNQAPRLLAPGSVPSSTFFAYNNTIGGNEHGFSPQNGSGNAFTLLNPSGDDLKLRSYDTASPFSSQDVVLFTDGGSIWTRAEIHAGGLTPNGPMQWQ